MESNQQAGIHILCRKIVCQYKLILVLIKCKKQTRNVELNCLYHKLTTAISELLSTIYCMFYGLTSDIYLVSTTRQVSAEKSSYKVPAYKELLVIKN